MGLILFLEKLEAARKEIEIELAKLRTKEEELNKLSKHIISKDAELAIAVQMQEEQLEKVCS